MAASTEQFEKLPTFAKPTNYKISLKPDLENFTCDGLVKIAISIVEKTNYVKLHSACNELTKISLSLENGKGLFIVLKIGFSNYLYDQL